MVPVVSIVGRKNSGKTTLIEGIIQELKKRGYRIGTIKHHTHGIRPEDIDREGKDTYRHQKAGADMVILSGPNKLILVEELNRPLTIDEIREAYLHQFDLILTEGYKTEDKPKIEIFRQEVGGSEGLLCTQEKNNLAAVVSNHKFDLSIPCFGLDDYLHISDFLEKEFISKREVAPLAEVAPGSRPSALAQDSDIELVVDQKDVYLKGFAAGFLKKAILGMISSLHGVPEEPQRVEIRIQEGK